MNILDKDYFDSGLEQLFDKSVNSNASVSFHPLVAGDAEFLNVVKQASTGFKEKLAGGDARQFYDSFLEQTERAHNVQYKQDKLGSVDGWWCRPENPDPERVVLYFHGGAYNLGTAIAYRNFVSNIASLSGTSIFIADYRLAPEHPYPAAVEDGKIAYENLIERAYTNISIMGDSSGGGLALVILAYAVSHSKKTKNVKPVSGIVMSPWTDLALKSKSLKTKREVDIFLTEEMLKMCAKNYVKSEKNNNPEISPVYGNLSSLPPIQIHVGAAEILLNDSVRYAHSAYQKGGSVELHIWEGMPHVFSCNVNNLVAANSSLDLMAKFMIS